MSDLHRVMKIAQANHEKTGEPITLPDLLTEAGYVEDYGQRRAMTASCQRALREGGSYNDLLGAVIVPGPRSRGRSASWAGDVEPSENKHPLPRLMSSSHLQPVTEVIEANNFYDRMTLPALKDVTSALVRGTKRQQVAVASVVTAQSNEAKVIMHQRDMEKERADMATARAEDLAGHLASERSTNEFLRDLFTSLGLNRNGNGNAGASAGNGRAASSTVPRRPQNQE